MKDLLDIERNVSDCGKPIVKLSSTTDCISGTEGGHFFGEGTIIDNSGAGIVKFEQKTNIHATIFKNPRKIERTISFFCKTQKVITQKSWVVEGLDVLPLWKIEEIEEILSNEHIFIDDVEVVYEGGDSPFTRVLKGCDDYFSFKMIASGCKERKMFGCNDHCNDRDGYINISDGLFKGDEKDRRFYNANMGQIAIGYEQFKTWLRNQDGVTNVEEVNNATLKCASYKLLKISGTPKFSTMFYMGDTKPSNKIYLRQVSSIDEVCTSQGNGECSPIIFGIPQIIQETCEPIQFGTPIILLNGQNCMIELQNNWQQGAGETKIIAGEDENSLYLSMFNTDYKEHAGTTTNYVYQDVNLKSIPQCTFVLTNGIGAVITKVVSNGDILNTSDYTFDNHTGELEITNSSLCTQTNNNIRIEYTVTSPNSPYSLYGQTIAKISGGCTPVADIYLTHRDNANIPDGTTILITDEGDVKWWGEVNFSDSTKSKVNIVNLVYKTI